MTTPFKHENAIKIAGVLGVAPELRLTANGNSVATLIVYTNYILRNEDGSTRQESERHRLVVWGLHAEKAARLLRKGSKIRVQGRMTYPTWKDKQTGATRYGAEIVAQTLDYQGANDEDDAQIAQPAAEAPVPQPAEPCDSRRQHIHHPILVLNDAINLEHRPATHRAAVACGDVRPDDDIGQAKLILDRQDFIVLRGRRRLVHHQHADQLHPLAPRAISERLAADVPTRG